MNVLFFYTGLIFWALFICCLSIILFEVIGYIVFGLKIVKIRKLKFQIGYFRKWVCVSFMEGKEYSRSVSDGSIIYKPWPWLSKTRRKELENSI